MKNDSRLGNSPTRQLPDSTSRQLPDSASRNSPNSAIPRLSESATHRFIQKIIAYFKSVDFLPKNVNWIYRKCSAQTRTGIGLLEKPPAVKQFLAVESHLGVGASYATRRKRRYEANKCGWTQPLFRKAHNCGINKRSKPKGLRQN